MMTRPEVRVEHHYPQALGFLQHHGPDAIAVLHDLLAHAEARRGEWVVRASVREIAGRLEFVSKDTVNRRLRQLIRAGVLEPVGDGDAFAPRTYRIHLHGSGITAAPERESA